MRRQIAQLFALVLTAVSALAAVRQGSPAAAASPAGEWPEGLPAPEVLASWELHRGQYTVDSRRVTYSLYVDPAFYALYRVTRYTISSPPGLTGDEALPMETVQFHATPGRGTPLCFQRRVGAAGGGPWQALVRGTQPYRDEMMRGIEVYARHRDATP